MEKRKIVVNQKQYALPDRINTMDYLDYMDALDAINAAPEMRRPQFELMINSIVKMYGYQFTEEDVTDPKHGLQPQQIIVEFTFMEADIQRRVNGEIEKMKENFPEPA